ncbi:uncharacterized protein DS421_8g238490 [Arachis hypogaea]|nr:uncharacterized protein DS421_8g238490 [Arachis hypogaea]
MEKRKEKRAKSAREMREEGGSLRRGQAAVVEVATVSVEFHHREGNGAREKERQRKETRRRDEEKAISFATEVSNAAAATGDLVPAAKKRRRGVLCAFAAAPHCRC